MFSLLSFGIIYKTKDTPVVTASIPNILILAAGMAVGLCALFLPPLWVASTPLLIFTLWLIGRRPEIGILVIISYTSTVLDEDLMPILPIGIGSLHISDLLLLWLFAVLIFRMGIVRDLQLQRTPLDIPILLFLLVSVLSTAKGVFSSSIEFHDGVRDLRYVAYYAIYFSITNLLVEEQQIKFLSRGLTTLAALTAGAMTLQFVVGDELKVLPGRVEPLYTDGIMYDSITRVIPPGESLIYVEFIVVCVSLALADTRKETFTKLALINLYGLGLILTFRRMLWGTAAMSIMGIGLLIPRDSRARLARRAGILAIVLIVGVTGILVAMPESSLSKTMSATLNRASTIFDSREYRRGDQDKVSLEERAIELSYALPQVMPPSFIGIGLGAPYRPCLSIDREDECDVPKYIHNGHVGILLKLGIIGYMAFLWLSQKAITRGLKYWRHVGEGEAQIRVLGFTVVYISLIVASMLEPYFILWNWTPVLAAMLGYNETLMRHATR